MSLDWHAPHRVLRYGACAVVVVVAVAAIWIGQIADVGREATVPSDLWFALGTSCTVMGGVMSAYLPRHPVGRLMLAAGLAAVAYLVAVSWNGWRPAGWISQWLWWPPVALLFVALLLFPDGTLPSRRWRPLAGLLVVSMLIGGVCLALAAWDHPHDLLSRGDDFRLSRAEFIQLCVALAAVLVSAVGWLLVLLSLVSRWRAADGDVRRQLACVALATAVLIVALVMDSESLPNAWLLAGVAVPLGMTTAVLGYHLYDLDLVLNRTIVWLVMTALVIIVFVALVDVMRNAFFDVRQRSLAATVFVALGFEPLHRRVQHRVDRLLYGDRDDPYAVIARLGAHLERIIEPNAVLPQLTATIAQSLQVPFVAVELSEAGTNVLAAQHGREVAHVQAFPMVAHGRPVGRLLVATRSPGGRFTRRERRLLDSVALQAAVAAAATRLTRDLQRSRERLVAAREEERRRLRRDLHDGLGPAVAGLAMQLRAARRLVDDRHAGEILDAAGQDLQRCAHEVRRLVDDLRPPALDMGLESALQAEVDRFCRPDLSVRLTVDGTLEGLPAAVEVAAYRIVAESLTNIARHARASTAHIDVRIADALCIDVCDDGIGLPRDRAQGTGLSSMQERAAALGGELTVQPMAPSGTRVQVRLPATLRATTLT